MKRTFEIEWSDELGHEFATTHVVALLMTSKTSVREVGPRYREYEKTDGDLVNVLMVDHDDLMYVGFIQSGAGDTFLYRYVWEGLTEELIGFSPSHFDPDGFPLPITEER